MWRDLAEQQALADHRQQPHQRDVKNEQGKLQAVPVASRDFRVWRDARKRASSEIEEILSEAGAARLAVIQVKRPYGKRNEILKAAISWCAATYGKTIIERHAQECWDAFSAMTKRLAHQRT
ncbi:hypothetical protein [Bradyrhizobium japonicum]|uniref:hypothetical protein n=1 Tax=Bradyrhizobium japonicum TaxID=375 RepID=UPI0011806A0A|nr:hypothetical protein [Bradyrhizobium japonicum]